MLELLQTFVFFNIEAFDVFHPRDVRIFIDVTEPSQRPKAATENFATKIWSEPTESRWKLFIVYGLMTVYEIVMFKLSSRYVWKVEHSLQTTHYIFACCRTCNMNWWRNLLSTIALFERNKRKECEISHRILPYKKLLNGGTCIS